MMLLKKLRKSMKQQIRYGYRYIGRQGVQTYGNGDYFKSVSDVERYLSKDQENGKIEICKVTVETIKRVRCGYKVEDID